jgi:hypothetical protein
MGDKNKINQSEDNKGNFKRENDRANSTYQRLIKESKYGIKKKIKKCNLIDWE